MREDALPSGVPTDPLPPSPAPAPALAPAAGPVIAPSTRRDGRAGTAVAPRTGSPDAGRARRLVAHGALAVIVLLTVALVASATAGPSALVPRSQFVFPGWEAGPLHAVTTALRITNQITLGQVLSAALVVLLLAYLTVLATVRAVSMRTIAVVVVGLQLALLLSPPAQLTDIFNYLGYARLGALHHLDPYTHGMSAETFDPIFRFTSWHDLKSPYGELFTMLTYPLALMPIAVAYWVLKAVTVALSLAFTWLVYVCAKRLHRDPRYAVAFVALNPVFLFYAVGGFHNDFLMLVPSMAAIALVLGKRDRSAGACLTIAVAVKFTALLIGPFLLLALMTNPRRRRFIAGALIAAVPLVVASVLLFGSSLPNLQQQSTLLTDFSIPNLVGLPFGVGGTPALLKLAELCVVLVVAYWFLRRRGRWLAGAGWSTLALILSLSWAVPWYVVWLLPLAALARSLWLRRVTLALTAFLMLAFLPVTSQYITDHNINPLHTPAGQASRNLQNRLAN